jgi:hypothetical protein
MASLQAHLRQAQHNEKLAQELLASMEYKDWIITITFYAAIHYVEAAFFQNAKIVHTETAITPNYPGGYYGFRSDMILQYYPAEVDMSYRKLYQLSRIARYLYFPLEKGFLEKPVQEYFSDSDVTNFLQKDLATIRQSLSF